MARLCLNIFLVVAGQKWVWCSIPDSWFIYSVYLKQGGYRSLDSSYTLLSPPSLTRPIFVVHLEGPAQLLLGRPAGRHVRGHHELLQKHEASAIRPPPPPHTLKSMLPLPSLSNILNIWSTKTLALPAGSIMEYISRILSLLSWPSGQSCLNPLESDNDNI